MDQPEEARGGHAYTWLEEARVPVGSRGGAPNISHTKTYTILHYTVLYYTILYYAVLYCIVLYYNMA